MLTRLIMCIKEKEKINVNMSSLFQGVLMEWISPQYAELLHHCERPPYSISLLLSKEKACWEICTLDKTARTEIIDKILNLNPKQIYISNKDLKLSIESIVLEEMEFSELIDSTYFGECAKTVEIAFNTPTSFKVEGKYQFYPTVRHIFYSLISKYDAVASDNQIYSEEILDQFIRHIDIIRYNLRSRNFQLEGVRIPGFVGTVTLKIRGPQQFVNLVNMLLKFGEYSGVGIKTSIGMGSLSIENRERSKSVGQ